MRKNYLQWINVGSCTVMLLCTFLLNFTISDYYIFNRFLEYGVLFCLCQLIKKMGILLLPMAIFFRRKSCRNLAKWILPLFTICSCFLYGDFFDIQRTALANGLLSNGAILTPEALEVYNQINAILPKWLHVTLFFVNNASILLCCTLLFVEDGWRCDGKSFCYLPFALLAMLPLNIFENFFDITTIPQDSFWRFGNFTIWHFLIFLALITFTVVWYFFLKKKDFKTQKAFMACMAISMMTQYCARNSMFMGDGYNVYYHIFAALPLFICSIGVFTASLSTFLHNKTLYSISFVVHAAGALTVFFYFGRDDMSNYGIILSNSILNFCWMHLCLFALCVLPVALGMYRFRMKDMLVPLLYYFVVIILASIASALVTSYSMGLTLPDGSPLPEEFWILPNYAFTQINPLPIAVPELWMLTIGKYELNVLYILILYVVYVAIFYLFIGGVMLFQLIKNKIFPHTPITPSPTEEEQQVIETV